MHVLLLADIHANYQAQKATLAAFPSVDEVWCLGDLVACGPCPEECIALVRQTCRHVVKGNHDAAEGLDGSLSPATRRYLQGLPESLSVTVGEHSYLLMHGSPANPTQGALWPDTPADALQTALAGVAADFILAGHTHMAMRLAVGGQLVVNPGSIGQPRDGDYRAQCALIDDHTFRFVRLEYDLHALAQDYARATAMPAPERDKWLRDTSRGIVEEHGLQRGPFTPAP